MLTTQNTFTCKSIRCSTDTSQDLTWLLFGYNSRTKTWDDIRTCKKHACYGFLVKRVMILIEVWALIDKMPWCFEDTTCIGAFKEYLYNISQSKLPATSLVAHAFVRGLSFSNDENGWPRPNYQDEEQLWSCLLYTSPSPRD